MITDLINNLLSLPVLSVRQPWASYLVSGLKSVELRTWSSQYRGWVWIHAGKRPDIEAMDLLDVCCEDFRCGGLLGLAKIENYLLIDSENKWIELRGEHLSPGYYSGSCYGWQMSDVIGLPDIVQCPGELGLFKLKRQVYEKVYHEIESCAPNEFLDCARDLVLAQADPTIGTHSILGKLSSGG